MGATEITSILKMIDHPHYYIVSDELKKCLSNEINHPTAAGHKVFALALMQLFQ
jgi:hypothetical protein